MNPRLRKREQSVSESTAMFLFVSNYLPKVIPGILGLLIEPPPGRDLIWRGFSAQCIQISQSHKQRFNGSIQSANRCIR